MTHKIDSFHEQALKHSFRGVIDITYPRASGIQNSLMFVKTNAGDYAAKFSTRDMVLKNIAASRLAASYGIRTPDMHAGEYRGTWFEYYPLIPGKTLYEHILDGMPQHLVKQAFTNILTQFAYMDNLPTENIGNAKCAHVHETAHHYAKNVNGSAIANILRALVYMANRGKRHNVGLYHSDITPKNVIVDDAGNLVSFLDMDSMTICNRSFAFAVIADKWVDSGFDIKELYDLYEYMIGRPINRMRIDAMLRAVHAGKSFMFRAAKNKTK